MLEAAKVVAAIGPYPFILVALGFGAWRIALWGGPIARQLLEAHVQGMKALTENTTALKDNTERTADAVEHHSEVVEHLTKLVETQIIAIKHYGEVSVLDHRTTREMLIEIMDRLEFIASEAGIKLPLRRRKTNGIDPPVSQ